MISMTKLDGGFGATIAGVDLSAAMAEDTVKGILDAFYAHQVIVIPGQSLSTDRFIEIGRLFGTPQPHVLRHLHHDGHPEILLLSNVMKDGEPVGIYDGAAYWHTDQSYDAEPASATVVHAVQVPARGGETRFADMYRAYDTLPDTTKRRIDGLTVCHRYGNRDDPDGKTRHGAAKLRGQQKAAVRAVTHPLVRSHPITGRKALYAVAGTSHGIGRHGGRGGRGPAGRTQGARDTVPVHVQPCLRGRRRGGVGRHGDIARGHPDRSRHRPGRYPDALSAQHQGRAGRVHASLITIGADYLLP